MNKEVAPWRVQDHLEENMKCQVLMMEKTVRDQGVQILEEETNRVVLDDKEVNLGLLGSGGKVNRVIFQWKDLDHIVEGQTFLMPKTHLEKVQ